MVERFRSTSWISFALVYILALASLIAWPRVLALTDLFRGMGRHDPSFTAYQVISAVIYLYPLFVLAGVVGSMISYHKGKTDRAIMFLLLCFIPVGFALVSVFI